jgi:hypothetical protein
VSAGLVYWHLRRDVYERKALILLRLWSRWRYCC